MSRPKLKYCKRGHLRDPKQVKCKQCVLEYNRMRYHTIEKPRKDRQMAQGV